MSMRAMSRPCGLAPCYGRRSAGEARQGSTGICMPPSSRNRNIRRRNCGRRLEKTEGPIRDPIPERRRHPGDRSREDRLPGLRHRLGGRGAVQPEVHAPEAREVPGRPFALSGRDGSLLDFPHHGRFALASGHEVRLIAPSCASCSGARENAADDTEAIATAVRQPGMRFVKPKGLDHQAAAIPIKTEQNLVGFSTRFSLHSLLLRSSHACLSGKPERHSPPYRHKSDPNDWLYVTIGIHAGISQSAVRINLSSYRLGAFPNQFYMLRSSEGR